MSTPTNHWKLGFFVVVGGLLSVFAIAALGSQSLRKETVRYTSFFDEAVTGLEMGSPISFRGVTVGRVAEIGIAPDRRHVAVGYDLTVSVLLQLGLARRAEGELKITVPPDVRVQIASTGVTGVKYVSLDFFEAAPVVELPFPVPDASIPAKPSTLKNLEQAVSRSVDKLPEVLDQLSVLIARADAFMVSLDSRNIPQKSADVLVTANRTLGSLERRMAELDTKALTADAQHTLASVDDVMVEARQLLAKVERDDGLLGSVQRASDAVGDVASSARGTGDKLDRTLDQVTDMATSMQRLVDAIEQDSDMLLKGRARSAP